MVVGGAVVVSVEGIPHADGLKEVGVGLGAEVTGAGVASLKESVIAELEVLVAV